MHKIHEALGDDYLAEMRALGIARPPVVAWATDLRGVTVAFILWGEGDETFVTAPREALVSAVVARVVGRCGAGN